MTVGIIYIDQWTRFTEICSKNSLRLHFIPIAVNE